MSGRRQRENFILTHRDAATLPSARFEWAGERSGKIRCVLCHRDGWGSLGEIKDQTGFDGRLWRWHDRVSPWQIDCLQDHPWPCSCGRSYRAFGDLWRHIGGERPTGWGRQEIHEYALACDLEAVLA